MISCRSSPSFTRVVIPQAAEEAREIVFPRGCTSSKNRQDRRPLGGARSRLFCVRPHVERTSLTEGAPPVSSRATRDRRPANRGRDSAANRTMTRDMIELRSARPWGGRRCLASARGAGRRERPAEEQLIVAERKLRASTTWHTVGLRVSRHAEMSIERHRRLARGCTRCPTYMPDRRSGNRCG